MSLTVSPISSINFTSGTEDDKKHVSASEVGVATGATVGGAKYGTGTLNRAMKAFKEFDSAKKISDGVDIAQRTTNAIKETANAGIKVKSMWGKMFDNAKTYQTGIVNWCKSTKMAKYMKPVFESKAFSRVSGVVGGVTALFVFISGLGEMADLYSRLASK